MWIRILVSVWISMLWLPAVVKAQKGEYDSVAQKVSFNFDGVSYSYQKPKAFDFGIQLPRTFATAAKETFNKKSIPALTVIVGATLILLPMDQVVFEKSNQFSSFINLNPKREYQTVIGFDLGKTPVNVYEAPQNFNTFLYSLGEGWTSIFIVGGLFIHGKIKQDYRSLQTSSQLMQSLLAVGLTTQFLKRATGRESPFVSTAAGGVWSPFTSPGVYQKKIPSYDAFPSGHLATMMATTTVLSLNYPEKKWIKPVGYSLITLVAFSMVNNGVHWVSDYPLALGIGYLFGKVTVEMNRWVNGNKK